jgi:hypothetical protein
MKTTYTLLTFCLLLFSCKKETNNTPPLQPTHPEMYYKDLNNAEVKRGGNTAVLDIDGDGSIDFSMGVLLVGDPVLVRDRVQFIANSTVKRNLLNNAADESPVLNYGDSIGKTHNNYSWFEISSILLAEKIITYNGNFWEGVWKNADHKFLPVQIEKDGKIYHGWIELSFSTQGEKLILHRSAISKQQDVSIAAGK